MEQQKNYIHYCPYPFPKDVKWKKPMSNLAIHPSLDTSWQCWLNAVEQEGFIWEKYQMARYRMVYQMVGKWNNKITSNKLQTWSSAKIQVILNMNCTRYFIIWNDLCCLGMNIWKRRSELHHFTYKRVTDIF